ncbi:MAG: DUF3786 domain-containing protein [Desulfobacteraceae bacterium]|nr:DUF3786 domain-containing protein [Desulfobacteraceae bacterium]
MPILTSEKYDDNSFVFDFFNRKIKSSKDEFHALDEEPLTDAIKNVFHQYLSQCPDSIGQTSNKLVTLREFSDSGPLFSRFTANINKIIETTFSGQVDNLLNRCHRLGGTVIDNASYDLSIKFKALSKIPIILNFNDTDEMMPANAVFLFQDSANNYLDIKGLGTLLTYLTGQLIQQ